jgi:hypothetical protein
VPLESGVLSGAANAGSGAEAGKKKKGRVKYVGLRGWVKCKGDAFLKSQDQILKKRVVVSQSLSKLRIWALLFALLVGRRPVAADLFCGEGGMSHGLALAGFDVDAVDIVARPKFTQHPNVTFILGDALKVDLSKYDIVFASPPCQSFSTMKYAAGAEVESKELNLIPDVRKKCEKVGIDYCIENVITAGKEMVSPIGLCGTMFGLNVARHRLFEMNWQVDHKLECDHAGYCLGTRAKLQKLNADGSPRYCCKGNLWGPYGQPGKRTGGTIDWSDAMNMHHMSTERFSAVVALLLWPVYWSFGFDAFSPKTYASTEY